MFWLKLSLALHIPVRRLQRELTSLDFAEYMAFDQLSPIGHDRFDLLAGIIASASVAPYTPKGKHPPRPKDFMPQYDPPEPLTADEIARRMKAVTSAFRGKFK